MKTLETGFAFSILNRFTWLSITKNQRLTEFSGVFSGFDCQEKFLTTRMTDKKCLVVADSKNGSSKILN